MRPIATSLEHPHSVRENRGTGSHDTIRVPIPHPGKGMHGAVQDPVPRLHAGTGRRSMR
jgi:hypothetical protein